MDTHCPYCSKKIFQVIIRQTYQLHRDIDPAVDSLAHEEVEMARCASCSRALPRDMWEQVMPRTH